MTKSSVLWLLPFCLLASAALAQPIQVKDVNTALTGGTWLWPFSTDFVEAGGIAWFVVSDGIHGLELWRSDGTAAGTSLVRDICPGACSGRPGSLTALGTMLYFSADDGAHGVELWKTDGTEAGTVLVRDIEPGLDGSNPSGLFDLGGAIGFSATQDATGRELWRSDGTEAGTTLVKDLWPGPQSSEPQPWGHMGGIRFLGAWDAVHGLELWKTDGTAEGTVLVKDVNPGPDSSLGYNVPYLPGYAPFVVSGSRLYFSALEPGTGAELWASDGTEAGTALVKDIAPGTFSSSPFAFVALGGQILFRANDDVHGYEIWKSDGTEANTLQIKDVQPGSTGSTPWELTVLGSWVFFRANDGTHGSELWKTDGTEVNTTLVKDIRAGAEHGLPFFGPAGFAAVGTTLVFFADDGTHGLEPWESDGTEAGTTLLADLNPSGPSQYQLHPVMSDRRAVLGGRWYFRAFDEETDVEVYTSDGTPAGTGQLKEINDQTSAFDLTYPGWLFGANPLAGLNGTLFFQASDGLSGHELWKSDGTALGTEQVADVFPGATGSLPIEITPLGSKLLFNAEGSLAQGRELWASDGTEAGTTLLADIEPSGSTSGGDPWWLTRVGGLVYFSGFDGSTDKLWKSDGTPAGTMPVRDAAPTAYDPTELTPLGSLLLYSGSGPDGTELWKTDGTAPGTVQVKDIAPAGSSSPDRLTLAGNRIFFSADDGSSGRELWVTDGTGPGTSRVKDIAPGAGSGIAATVDDLAFRIERWAGIGSNLVFPADAGTGHGEELWVSGGTGASTFELADVLPGARSSEIHGLTSAGHRAYFVADDGAHGRELWVTDGTIAGTRLVADLVPGEGSSLPEQLLAVGNQLLFSAHTPDSGREPWITDGDAVGTRRLADLAPGSLPSSPLNFTFSGARVDFVATDGSTGFELYSVPRAEVDGSMDFYTVAPCRLVDTRQSGGPLGAGLPRIFAAAGLCGVPSTARALAVNVTVVGATAAGDVVLYRGSTARPPTSTIPFAAGQTRANNAMVHLGDGEFTAVASPESMAVHLIVDVGGYYE